MKTTKINNNFLLVTGLILAAVASRIIPHPFNFTPMIAVALFAGAKYREKTWSVFIPVVAFLISEENGYVSGQTIAIDGGESNIYGNS